METPHYCPACDITMRECETDLRIDHETVEFWGGRDTMAQEFIVCGCCGGDLEDAPAPVTIDEEDE
jgi:hypothetical protein